MRTRRAAPVMVAALVVGCSALGPEPAGEEIGSWSQGDDSHREWVDEAMPIETVVLGSDADREAWLEDVPGDAADEDSFDSVRAVDLDESVIVIGGYPRCTEHSVVTVSGDDEVAFEVRDDEEDTACGWSPYTIDAWSVPLELTDGQVPEVVDGP